jgi:hypothetical protein
MRHITESQARDCWAILVRECGNRGDVMDEYAFVYHVAVTDSPAREYRLNALLGTGGKFRNNGNNNDVPHVDCYPEHLNEERQALIDATNAALLHYFSNFPDDAAGPDSRLRLEVDGTKGSSLSSIEVSFGARAQRRSSKVPPRPRSRQA